MNAAPTHFLRGLRVHALSLVDRGANKRRFRIYKAADPTEGTTSPFASTRSVDASVTSDGLQGATSTCRPRESGDPDQKEGTAVPVLPPLEQEGGKPPLLPEVPMDSEHLERPQDVANKGTQSPPQGGLEPFRRDGVPPELLEKRYALAKTMRQALQAVDHLLATYTNDELSIMNYESQNMMKKETHNSSFITRNSNEWERQNQRLSHLSEQLLQLQAQMRALSKADGPSNAQACLASAEAQAATPCKADAGWDAITDGLGYLTTDSLRKEEGEL